jgi:hypothetical protein
MGRFDMIKRRCGAVRTCGAYKFDQHSKCQDRSNLKPLPSPGGYPPSPYPVYWNQDFRGISRRSLEPSGVRGKVFKIQELALAFWPPGYVL